MEEYDVVIAGAGPAGLTAGIYAGRDGLKTLVLEKALKGGMGSAAPLVMNFPAFKSITGMFISPELLQEMDLEDLETEKYKHPKYAVKMATGTGKTWVMNAILIWQYLNAKYEDQPSGRFSKNFLIVAPGLIVYERLLDAFLGKEQVDGTRNFEESDFKKFEKLFIPSAYKNTIFGFIQSNLVKKEEIGKKVTGDGMIAITNWHLLAGEDEKTENLSPIEDPVSVMDDILPIAPGKASGNALDSLDNRYLRGMEIEYLKNLPDMPLPVEADLKKLTTASKGMSGRDIKDKLLKVALHRAISEDRESVTWDDVEYSLKQHKKEKNEPKGMFA